MIDIAGDNGMSSNSLTFWSYLVSFTLAILVDCWCYYFGYNNSEVHWFVFVDIWRKNNNT